MPWRRLTPKGLPPKTRGQNFTPVLFYVPTEGVCAGRYFYRRPLPGLAILRPPVFQSLQGRVFRVFHAAEVNHWMPLPAPPKGCAPSRRHRSPAEAPAPPSAPFEVIDSKELARRWCVPETWVREQIRQRSRDPIPHVRLGKYVRFEWQSHAMLAWWASHRKK